MACCGNTEKPLSHMGLLSLSFCEELHTKGEPPSDKALKALQNKVKTDRKQAEPE